jgi:hypothetical protein
LKPLVSFQQTVLPSPATRESRQFVNLIDLLSGWLAGRLLNTNTFLEKSSFLKDDLNIIL